MKGAFSNQPPDSGRVRRVRVGDVGRAIVLRSQPQRRSGREQRRFSGRRAPSCGAEAGRKANGKDERIELKVRLSRRRLSLLRLVRGRRLIPIDGRACFRFRAGKQVEHGGERKTIDRGLGLSARRACRRLARKRARRQSRSWRASFMHVRQSRCALERILRSLDRQRGPVGLIFVAVS